MEALQAEHPRIAPQDALVQRLQALAGELPEARWPLFASEDEDEEGTEPAPDVEQASEAEAPLAGLDALGETSMPVASDAAPDLIAEPLAEDALEPVPSAPDLRTPDVAADSGRKSAS